MDLQAREVVSVKWPFANAIDLHKNRPAIVAHVDEDGLALLFPISSKKSKHCRPFLKDSYVSADYFLRVSKWCLRRKNLKAPQEVVDWLLTTASRNMLGMASVENSYATLV